MGKRYFPKVTFLFITISIYLLTIFSAYGICESMPLIERYNLKDYSLNVNFCQDGTPKITKTYRATKHTDGEETELGRLRIVLERDYSREDYCAVSLGFYEEYPGDAHTQSFQFEYAIDSEKGWREKGYYSGDPPFIKWTYLNPLLTCPHYDLYMGDTWGGKVISKGEYVHCVTCVDITLSGVYQYALIGVDEVTVPYGTFSDCLRVARFRGSMSDRIAWYCSGVGRVKMIYSDTSPYSRKFELENISLSK